MFVLRRAALPKGPLFRQHRALATGSTSPTSALRTGVYTTVFALSTGLFAFYYFDARSALHRYIVTPVLRRVFDAETSHAIALQALRSGLGPRDPAVDEERLKCEIFGQQMSNPVGLAAGFDKNGEAIDGLFNLGFSWVEIGSVTPNPQAGNPQPRIFRLEEDDAVINRSGFPSQGHMAVLSRVKARAPSFITEENDRASFRPESMLAVSLGKNKTSPLESINDYVAGVKVFGPYADVLVVNVSSPNTPGLRGLQHKDLLEALLTGVTKARDAIANKPRLVLKLAPDLDASQISDVASVIRGSGIDGVIVSNTTLERPASLFNENKKETGGLSGAPLKALSLKVFKALRAELPSTIPMIGCGGIFTGEDALEYARAGAAMVQIYTSLAYDGPGACRRIKDDIAASLAQTGETWQDVVKKAVTANSWVPPPPAKEVAASPEWTVKELTAEAEELKKLLEAFEGKHTNDIVQPKSASLISGVPSSKDSTDATVKQLVAEAEELGKALQSFERKTKAVADYDEDFE
ncbi:hypothetical protein CYLTODRAFT_422662 [Cylindrobasidium torrendii FP15055 ss-10]|uniref:Dihydroorotate dehydrogenase (quinone), mitochondrial n=1 Tax=Cylindrobasidium torrendii FP15055 ss-10 TaxID=1314674 RepID=A0A0D7BAT1_9AGAR|nr:hypothetical protein CYLTODRAFT_422662 [Cylindrobasidium torrendii FP15055 ss-10]